MLMLRPVVRHFNAAATGHYERREPPDVK
jgi:hypothetical protein